MTPPAQPDDDATPARLDAAAAAAEELLDEALDLCTTWSRGDLADRLRWARARLARPSALVVIVGEYKQGKSQLVNALVGREVCPVDDDLATAAMVAVGAGDRDEARVRRRIDGEPRVDVVPLGSVADHATEQGTPTGVELVEITVAGATLPAGLTLVDTPGVGGLLRQHADATLRFLGLADGVVFTTDASQEFTAPELDLLRRVHRACPQVVVAMTKADLYPHAEAIAQRDRDHLAADDLPLPVLVVSADLQLAAVRGVDAALADESGVPTLTAHLRTSVLDGARGRTIARAYDDIRWAVEGLVAPVTSELRALQDPARADALVARLEAARSRLEELQEAGARWATVLNDGFTDLRADADHRLRSGMRGVLAHVDAALEDSDPAAEWDDFTRDVQGRIAAVVTDLFAGIDDGVDRVAAQLIDLLRDEEDVALPDNDALAEDLTSRLQAPDAPARDQGPLATGLAALRGGSGGVILVGMIGRLAGLAVTGPLSIGVAVAFGVKQLTDVRKQSLQRRRQEARTLVRRLVDEVSLEAGNRTRQLVTDRHRQLRDTVGARLKDLAASATAAHAAAQQAATVELAQREERIRQLATWEATLQALLDRVPDAGATS